MSNIDDILAEVKARYDSELEQGVRAEVSKYETGIQQAIDVLQSLLIPSKITTKVSRRIPKPKLKPKCTKCGKRCSSYNSRFCSSECAKIDKYENLPERECKNCHRLFKPQINQHVRTNHCSIKCRNSRVMSKKPTELKVPPHITKLAPVGEKRQVKSECKNCGRVIVGKIYCRNECRIMHETLLKNSIFNKPKSDWDDPSYTKKPLKLPEVITKDTKSYIELRYKQEAKFSREELAKNYNAPVVKIDQSDKDSGERYLIPTSNVESKSPLSKSVENELSASEESRQRWSL